MAPFPAGLNDCVSGLKWVATTPTRLNIDPERIVVAGESGGGNLTLATGLKLKRDGDLGLIKGLYALCPYIAGQWPRRSARRRSRTTASCSTCTTTAAPWATASRPSTSATRWPGRPSPTVEDVTGFPPTVINVNECDPLRDEGINFYRLLLEPACRPVAAR